MKAAQFSFLIQSSDVFHVYAIALQNVCEFLWTDGDRTFHEFRDVVAAHELPVIVGVGGRQFKRFAAMPFGVDMGDEGTGESPIVASAAENHPSAIARPRMITFRVRGIQLVHFTHVPTRQVHHPQVGIMVPDVEIAVVGT